MRAIILSVLVLSFLNVQSAIMMFKEQNSKSMLSVFRSAMQQAYHMVQHKAHEKYKNYLQYSMITSHKQMMRRQQIIFVLYYENKELWITYQVIGSVNKVSWQAQIKNFVWYTSIPDLNQFVWNI